MSQHRLFAIATGIAAAFLAAPVAAQSINGNYDANACQNEYRSQAALDIAWPEITFFESGCTITGTVSGMSNTYTTSCSGEGESWDGQIGITPLADGNLIIELNGDSTTYNRC